MTRKGSAITLSLQERDKTALQQIALDLGMTWGDRPNISKLIEAIARHQFLVTPSNDWDMTRIQALLTAQQLLIDSGYIAEAQILAELLLSRSELTIPQRSQLQQFVDHPPPPWRQTIDQHIRSHKPFRLSYCDAADRPYQFTIRYAQITPIEKRQYLQCWCDETDGNQDLPELRHNWTFRLDRIPTAAITPIQGKWRPALDTIPVELYFFNGLAFAYEAKPQDTLNEILTDSPPIRRIVRQVSHTFWLVRELLRYGKDCELVSPTSLRDRMAQEVRSLSARYDRSKDP